MYTAGSLFSGIGGIDLAFSRAGFDVRWQVEIEPFCRAVLSKHAAQYWPNARIYNDVKEVGKSCLEPVDVIFGGFPCQDISSAGKGAGIKQGTRSGLWFEFARIIGELRPRYVFLENVSAIVRRGADVVSGSLSEIGYGAAWIPVPASAVGAPHKRDRWFCVAYSHSRGSGTAGIDGMGAALGERRNTADHTPALENSSLKRTNVAYPDGGGWIQTIPCNQDGITSGSNKALAYSTSECDQRQFRNETDSQWEDTPRRSELFNQSGNSSETMENADSDGSGSWRAEWSGQFGESPLDESSWRQIKSLLGRAVNGLSQQLDCNRWPSLPGQPQYRWEAPRTIAQKLTNRPARLKALGNAVVPQVVQPFAEAIYSILEEINTQDGAA